MYHFLSEEKAKEAANNFSFMFESFFKSHFKSLDDLIGDQILGGVEFFQEYLFITLCLY